jgi:glycerophosphoryl diester phosphodiesterase
MLTIGHRGLRAVSLENTLPSLQAAIDAGLAMTEFDVQLHPSGQLFLLHDLTLERTHPSHVGFAHSQPWWELAALGLPTLEQALDVCKGKIAINIEIKTWNGTAAAIAACLQKLAYPLDEVLVSSFHLPELMRFRALLPQVKTGALICGIPLESAAFAANMGCTHLNLSQEFVEEALVKDAHQRGLQVLAYTVNDRATADYLESIGVDGIFSDHAELQRIK